MYRKRTPVLEYIYIYIYIYIYTCRIQIYQVINDHRWSSIHQSD